MMMKIQLGSGLVAVLLAALIMAPNLLADVFRSVDEDGNVTSVAFKDRLEAHRLIEEFMILANVAAAETLNAKRQPLLFRVHEEPPPEKLDALRETALASGLTLAKGQVLKTAHLNRLLRQAQGKDEQELINLSTR